MHLHIELVSAFVDDLTLGGPSDTEAADIEYIRSKELLSSSQVCGSTP